VIINLIDRVVETWEARVAGEDRYSRDSVIRPGEVVRFSVGRGQWVDVPAAQLFPPATA
jgi:hypothetical protein